MYGVPADGLMILRAITVGAGALTGLLAEGGTEHVVGETLQLKSVAIETSVAVVPQSASERVAPSNKISGEHTMNQAWVLTS
jgi:hypothetical protein